MPTQHQPTHADLADTLADLTREVEALRTELKPVADAYKAATIGARVLKWAVSILAGVAAIWGFWMGAPHP